MTPRYVYATNMGLLFRMTRPKWRAFCAASAIEWTDIGKFGDCVGQAHNVTDWEPIEFKEASQ